MPHWSSQAQASPVQAVAVSWIVAAPSAGRAHAGRGLIPPSAAGTPPARCRSAAHIVDESQLAGRGPHVQQTCTHPALHDANCHAQQGAGMVQQVGQVQIDCHAANRVIDEVAAMCAAQQQGVKESILHCACGLGDSCMQAGCFLHASAGMMRTRWTWTAPLSAQGMTHQGAPHNAGSMQERRPLTSAGEDACPMRLKGCLASTAAAAIAMATRAWAALMTRLAKSADSFRHTVCLTIRYAADHAAVERTTG